MKTRPIRLIALGLGLTGSLSAGPFSALGDLAVSVGVQVNAVAEFHAPLAPHGVWVEVGHYGRCWRPAHLAVGWRPYCDGHWEWTDCGWYWVSDEPWAWACYHYGSWVFESGDWFWVPGVEWAPAWVSWRVGGGHIGWAPCAPHGMVVAPSLFVFVDGPRFHERIRPSTVIVNNTTIINKTTQITEIKRETRNIAGRPQKVVVNEGPGVEVVQKMTGKKLAAAPIQEVDRRTAVPFAVKRRTLDSATTATAPNQEQTKPAPERKADQPRKTFPAEKPARYDRPEKASPPLQPDKPERRPPVERPDHTAPAEKPGKPDKASPGEKPDKPDRASPPDNSEKADRETPPSQRERGKGKEKGPGA